MAITRTQFENLELGTWIETSQKICVVTGKYDKFRDTIETTEIILDSEELDDYHSGKTTLYNTFSDLKDGIII